MSSNISKKILIYNFVLTMAIVAYHWKNFYDLIGVSNFLTKTISDIFDILGFLAMGSFFMISGYLMYHGAESIGDILEKMKRRLYSLLLPIVIWNTLALVYTVLYNMVFNNPIDLSLKKIILGYTLQMFDGPLWYLLGLLILMLLAPLIIHLKKYHKTCICVILIITILSIGASRWFLNLDWEYAYWFERYFRYWLYYFIGVYFALHHDNLISYQKYDGKTLMLFGAPCTVLSIIVILLCGGINDTLLHRIILYVLPFLFWISLDANIFGNVKEKFSFKISFFIYAMHYAFIIPVINTIAIPIIQKLNINSLLVVIIHFAFIVLLYFISWICAFLFKKVLPKKIFMAMSGGRS